MQKEEISLNKNSFNPTFLDHHPEAFLICHEGTGKIQYLNESFKSLFALKGVTGYVDHNIFDIGFFDDDISITELKKKLLAGFEMEIYPPENPNRMEYLYVCSCYDDSKIYLTISAFTISKWLKPKKELLQKEERYRNFAEFLPAMVCEADTHGVITFANRKAYLKFGYVKADLYKGVNVIDLIAPVDKAKAIRILKERNLNITIPPQEYLAITTKGKTFPVIVHMDIIKKKNDIVGYRGVMFDITERKKTENQLRDNYQQQELISNVALMLSNTANFNRKIVEVVEYIGQNTALNSVIIKTLKKDKVRTIRNEIKGEQSKNFSYEKETQNHAGFFSGLFVSQEEFICRSPEQANDTIKKILKTSNFHFLAVFPVQVLKNTIGILCLIDTRKKTHSEQEINVFRTLSIIISHAYERQFVEQELSEKESTQRAIIDSFPDILLLANKKGVIIDTNDYDERSLGKKRSKIIGKKLGTIYKPEIAGKLTFGLERCFALSNYVIEYEDENAVFESRYIRISEDLVEVIIRNISNQKKHQHELEKAIEKAQQASNSKSEFLANMSHEIRTPLNAILGFSEVLIDKSETAQYRSQLSAIYSAGQTLLSLINDILDLSKIEAGRMEILNEPVSLKDIFKEINQIFEQKILENNLSFIIDIDDDFPTYLLLDEVRIRQILFNMVGNSIKFTETGYIKLQATFAKYVNKNSGDLVFLVEDTGIGIPRNQQKLIFEAFRQQSGQSSRKYGGTGLGLAITKKLVEKMNGSITLESRIWKGTTFKVFLPGIEQKEKSHTGNKYYTDQSNIIFESSRVLVIDDIEYNIEVVKTIFSDSKNVEIISGNSGKQALEVLRNTIPDIILLDLRLPDEDGFAVAQKIKANKDWSNIPIMAFTASAFSLNETVAQGLFSGYIPKPVSKNQVFEELKKFLPFRDIQTEQKDSIDYLKLERKNENLEDLKSALLILTKLYEQKWRIIQNDLVIYDIENFTNEVKEVGNTYNLSRLLDYYEVLTSAVQSFDIEQMEKRIHDFPKLLEKINIIIQRSHE